MDRLGVFDLYEQNMELKTDGFMEQVDSSLKLHTDYEKTTKDTEWIDIIDQSLPYIDNILRNPNRFIVNEEEIVKIELARKITVDSIKHLSKNTNFIQDIDKKTGDVTPSKILNINKEENYDTYENRVIYTLIQNAKYFISRKKKALKETSNEKEKNDKHMEYSGKAKVANESVNINMQLNTTLDDSESSGKEDDPLVRAESLERRLNDLTFSEVYKIIDKKHITLISPPIKKTNVILKNVNFQYAMKLWDYLQNNLEDETTQVSEKNDYTDRDDLKQWVDETFLLNYLVINTLEKEREGQDEEIESIEKRKLKEELTEQMLEKIIDLNMNLTEEELKQMIGDKFVIIKYRNIATIDEIQRIFKEHIDKYLEKTK